jgi:hypothetical protein
MGNMTKLILKSIVFIIFSMAILHFSNNLEYTEAGIEWCQKSLSFMPIEICSKRVWVLYQ